MNNMMHERKSVQFTVRMREETKRLVNAYAIENNISRNAAIDQALYNYLSCKPADQKFVNKINAYMEEELSRIDKLESEISNIGSIEKNIQRALDSINEKEEEEDYG